MARIRTIKPEFPQSESVGNLSRDARLLFIQLWTIADDSGRARASSRMLASLLYPYDDDARDLIGGWLEELEAKDCIRRYVVDGSTYLEITNWLKHQKIDRPTPSRLPGYSDALASPRENSRALDADLGPGPGPGPGPSTNAADAASSDLTVAGSIIQTGTPHPLQVPIPLPANQEKDLFARGKQVLGASGGGLVARLLKAKGGDVALARAAIETASTKQDPREYIGAVIRKGADPPAAERRYAW